MLLVNTTLTSGNKCKNVFSMYKFSTWHLLISTLYTLGQCVLLLVCAVLNIFQRVDEALRYQQIKQTLTVANESLGLNKCRFHLQIKVIRCPSLNLGS